MRFILLFSVLFSLAQGDGLSLQYSIKGKNFVDIAPDQFGNLLILEGDNLKKLDPKGKHIASYSNPGLGTPTQVSAVDALNPLLFYRDANVLVTLDNRLNESVRTNLLEAGFYDVTLVCISDEERIWLYDQAQDKLFRYNLLQAQIEGTTLNLTQLSGTEGKPIQLVSTFNYIYANVPEVGIMRFTATGAFDKTIPLKQLHSFDVEGTKLYCLQDTEITCFDTKTLQLSTLLPLSSDLDLINLRATEKNLFLQGENHIDVYHFTP
jgi:hypothetical protein